ncbi:MULTISPECIES: hypothetical protein [Bacillus cereus group]|uniref:hypothetical protein n=1 Tax=Bacillus cereus group TaxID=86661 RepID=UPI000BEB3BF1|nr:MULTISPECIES: hypothetical protein [Bacillus cereus group]PEF50479.1 hypothetical protein CON56_21160 [Bacillus thuringiensis]PFO91826.1 hypothetical protein COJ97_27360 [Bacillus cereus]
MKFKDAHPDYTEYTSDTYEYDFLPRKFFDAFQGLIAEKTYEDEENATDPLRISCNIIAKNIPTKPTNNLGYYDLLRDLESLINKLSSKKIDIILDTVVEIASEIDIKMDKLNEVFKDNNFGFTLEYGEYEGYEWVVAKGTESRVDAIEEALTEVPIDQINVIEHLQQAKKQLKEVSETRSRKDALRDSISALEAQLKYYSGTKKFEDATKYIQTEYNIPRKIIGDAKNIWDLIHDKTPDVRHGSSINSDLSEAEALYWIDRIMALTKYLAREIE